MDLGYTTMLPVGVGGAADDLLLVGGSDESLSMANGQQLSTFQPIGGGGDDGPTETGTIAFGEGATAGAPTPAGSDFAFTHMLEGGDGHDAWGGQRLSMGGVELTAAWQRRESTATGEQATASFADADQHQQRGERAGANRRRMTLGVKAVQGIAHPADRRKSRAPFNMPDEENITMDLDDRAAKIMSNDTFEYLYRGGSDGASLPLGGESSEGILLADGSRPVERLTVDRGGNAGGGLSTPTLTDLSFGQAAGVRPGKSEGDDNVAEAADVSEVQAHDDGGNGTNADAALDLNLSDSFEVPPGADDAAASVAQHGLTPSGATARSAPTTTPHTANTHTDTWDRPLTQTTGAMRSDTDGFTPPGAHTMHMLLKMKAGGEHAGVAAGATAMASVSDPAAPASQTDGSLAGVDESEAAGPPTWHSSGIGDKSEAAAPGSEASGAAGRSTGAVTDTWDRPLTVTDRLVMSHPSNGVISPEVLNAGTPANRSVHSAASGRSSDSGGFTPGPDTLLMMEKLKGLHHDHKKLDSVRRALMPGGGRPSLAGGWGAVSGDIALSPLTAFTPNRAYTIAGGPAVNSPQTFGRTEAAPAFGVGSGRTAPGIATAAAITAANSPRSAERFTPGGLHRTASQSAGSADQDYPFDLSPGSRALVLETSSAPHVYLETFMDLCEVSFIDQSKRRKSLGVDLYRGDPPPETVQDGLRLVCLTAPMIEALDPLHTHLDSEQSSLTGAVKELKAEVERTQPPLLRLSTSGDLDVLDQLHRAVKMLKKECQLEHKSTQLEHKLELEDRVAASLKESHAALVKTASSLAAARGIAAEATAAAAAHEADLRRRITMGADSAARSDNINPKP
jgi:hypothetical protein